MALFILNSLIVPFRDQQSTFIIRRINPDEAKKIVQTHGFQFTSAVGHSATAQALSLILGVAVPVNRVEIYFNVGDEAIALVLRKRLAEGQVITNVKELEAIGFELYHIRRVE